MLVTIMQCLGQVFYLLFLESCLLNATKENWKEYAVTVVITSILVWRL